MRKRLIVGLSAGLGAALLMIAFLVGRATVNPAFMSPQPAETVAAHHSSDASTDSTSSAPSSGASPVASPDSFEKRSLASGSAQPAQIEQSNPIPTGANGNPVFAKQAIVSYFAKMDSIQVGGSGDTTTFAQGVLQGIKDGDLSRVDELVTNAKSALVQAKSVQPPTACAEYHARMLAVLSDAVAGMEQFKTALLNNDSKAMLVLASRFQSKQQELDRLELLKKQLLAN